MLLDFLLTTLEGKKEQSKPCNHCEQLAHLKNIHRFYSQNNAQRLNNVTTSQGISVTQIRDLSTAEAGRQLETGAYQEPLRKKPQACTTLLSM